MGRQPKDITGEKYGRLTAIEITGEKTGAYYKWKCQCDCGNIIIVASNNLKSGNTKSCGCLNKETIKGVQFKDITGKKYGRLTAIKATNQRKAGNVVWQCQCECGNICLVPLRSLTSGEKKSCGCLIKENNGSVGVHKENYRLINFYNKTKEAFEKKDWDIIEKALKEYEE